MCNTDTRDAAATLAQIGALADAGCEIARVAVPDMAAAGALPDIKRQSPLPIVADIHFDHRLALAALKAGVDGLRLNPGNIRDPEKVREVVRSARERSVPIRIGVNAGSLPPVCGGQRLERRGAARFTAPADGGCRPGSHRDPGGAGLWPDQGLAQGL